MQSSVRKTENRSIQRIIEHYNIEKKLADKLRYASKQDRICMYSSVYNDLFRLIHDHPQLTVKYSIEERKLRVYSIIRLLKRFLKTNKTFLEIGAGDCAYH